MADFEMKFPEDFLHMLSQNLMAVDEYAPKMLEAGADIVQSAVKSAMPSAIAHYASNVTHREAKKASNGGWVLPITFDGLTNHTHIPVMTLAAYWDYGTSKVPKTAWLRNAIAGASSAAAEAMTKVFEEEMSK